VRLQYLRKFQNSKVDKDGQAQNDLHRPSGFGICSPCWLHICLSEPFFVCREGSLVRSLIERYTLASALIWSLASLVKLQCIVDMIIDSICFKSLRIRRR
jgi:hypothetical protein